jgi:hypothetical protein
VRETHQQNTPDCRGGGNPNTKMQAVGPVGKLDMMLSRLKENPSERVVRPVNGLPVVVNFH